MNKLLLIYLFVFNSCSFLISTYEKDLLSEKSVKPVDQTKSTTCKIIKKNILLNESEHSQYVYNNLIKKVLSKYPIRFIDRAVLWSLLQMNLRPDLNSPTSKLQILIKYNGEEKYFQSFTKNEGLPYLTQLEDLLRLYNSKYSLIELARIYDQFLQDDLLVTDQFEKFLDQNKSKLAASPIFKRIYFRGDETLRKNERLPRLNMTKIIKAFNKGKNNFPISKNSHLFKFNKNSSFTPQCNFDMNLYKNSLFLINPTKVKSHIFGMKNNELAFMAVSSQDIMNYKPIGNTLLIKGSSDVRSASLCTFQNRVKQKSNLWLISTDSRDPGQHLFHLLEYGLSDLKSISELDEMLKFSRHLFLKNPVRLIFESRRSSEKQVQELLKLDIPIYNAKKLGKIWAYYGNQKDSSFVLDAREPGFLTCNSH